MRILFVCTGNSFRSPLAEALTRRFHPDLEVESAGIEAVNEVAEVTRERLENENALKYAKPKPDQISQRALNEADKVVCMMPKHSEYIKRNFDVNKDSIEIWRVKYPIHPNVEADKSFSKIKEKVKNLV